ncbi:MAG: ABC transporter permease [Lachnospiraceae bacterium]|nr:ABC transporter permease [Lachnospiraceae bacterium]
MSEGKKGASLPREMIENRRLIWSLAKNDFRTKYAGSYFGTVWAFIQPIVTVLVYWFVFQKGLKASDISLSPGVDVPFVLWLIAGLVPWFFFSDAWGAGTNTLNEYAYLVKKVVFNVSILPIVKIFSALFVHVAFLILAIVIYCCYGKFPDLYYLQLIYYSFCTFMLVLGISYATSAIVVFFKDLTQIVGIILQVGIWMTPIMWDLETMEISPAIKGIFKLNPLYYITSGYRNVFIYKVNFWEQPGLTLYFWGVTLVMFGIGMIIFKRLKVHFADVL